VGELEGTIWTQATLSKDRATEIGKIVGGLDSNFAVMSQGGDSNFIRGLVTMLVASLIIGFRFRRRKKNE
jgi:hypothetical protein